MNESTILSPSKVKDSYISFNATLRFDVIVYSSTKLHKSQLSKLKLDIKREPHHTLETVDIFKEVDPNITKIYIFDTTKYPVDIERLSETRKKLQNDLILASRKDGIRIKSTSLKSWGGATIHNHITRGLKLCAQGNISMYPKSRKIRRIKELLIIISSFHL